MNFNESLTQSFSRKVAKHLTTKKKAKRHKNILSGSGIFGGGELSQQQQEYKKDQTILKIIQDVTNDVVENIEEEEEENNSENSSENNDKQQGDDNNNNQVISHQIGQKLQSRLKNALKSHINQLRIIKALSSNNKLNINKPIGFERNSMMQMMQKNRKQHAQKIGSKLQQTPQYKRESQMFLKNVPPIIGTATFDSDDDQIDSDCSSDIDIWKTNKYDPKKRYTKRLQTKLLNNQQEQVKIQKERYQDCIPKDFERYYPDHNFDPEYIVQSYIWAQENLIQTPGFGYYTLSHRTIKKAKNSKQKTIQRTFKGKKIDIF